VNFKGVYQVIDAKTNDKGHPEGKPDQTHVGGHLDDPLLATGQRQQRNAQFVHDSLEHEFKLLPIDRYVGC
jgi:hypothetical protein